MYFIDEQTVIPEGNFEDLYTKTSVFALKQRDEDSYLWTFHFLNISENIKLETNAQELVINFSETPLVFDNYNLIIPVKTRYYKSKKMPKFYFQGKQLTLNFDNYLSYVSPKLLIEKSVCFLRKAETKTYFFSKNSEISVEIINTNASYSYQQLPSNTSEYLVVNHRIIAKTMKNQKHLGFRKFLYYIYFHLPIKQMRNFLFLWHIDQLIYYFFDDVDNTPYIDESSARKTCFKDELK